MLNGFGRRDACLRQPLCYPRPQEEAQRQVRAYEDGDKPKPWWLDDDYEDYCRVYTQFLMALHQRPPRNETALDALMTTLSEHPYVLAYYTGSATSVLVSRVYRQLLEAMVHQPSVERNEDILAPEPHVEWWTLAQPCT